MTNTVYSVTYRLENEPGRKISSPFYTLVGVKSEYDRIRATLGMYDVQIVKSIEIKTTLTEA